MSTDHFTHMKMALAIEEQSTHPDHKVGALLHGIDTNAQPFIIAKSNFWPPTLEKSIGRNEKLGNASTTVHAETAAILSAPATEDADLYITDLPCPNCAKAIAEARIKAVYIDAHTHNTPLGLKIKPFFETVSLPIFKSAQISIFEMDTKTNDIHALHSANPGAALSIEHPVTIHAIDSQQISMETFRNYIQEIGKQSPFAACIAKTPLGQYRFIAAKPHRSVGLKEQDVQNILSAQDKYLPTLQPLNRLLLTCARHGLKIEPDYLYSSQTPTAREFVNMIGAGYNNIIIENTEISRDQWGITALEQIQKHGILNIQTKFDSAA